MQSSFILCFDVGQAFQPDGLLVLQKHVRLESLTYCLQDFQEPFVGARFGADRWEDKPPIAAIDGGGANAALLESAAELA